MATDYKGVSAIMPFIFAEDDSTGYNTSATDLVGFNGQDAWASTWGIIIPFDGSVVGLSVTHQTSVATYWIKGSVNINNTVSTVAAVKNDAAVLTGYASYMPGAVTVSKGDILAVEMNSENNNAGVAGNVVVVVYVQVGSSGT